MKVDTLDLTLAGVAVFANTFARLITVFVLAHGGTELNPLFQNTGRLAFGGMLTLVVSFALFIIIDPYRKIALATFAGLLVADFVHDLCVVLGVGAYTTFAVSVVSALLPVVAVSIYLLYESDPRKEQLKKRRNWRMFNL